MSDFGGSNTPKHLRDLWRTPDFVFEAINPFFNFVCDIAASAENKKCEKFIDAEQDALCPTTRWPRGWKWCNPPYSDIGPWAARAAVERRAVLFIPAYVTTPSWGHVCADHATEIVLLRERIGFIDHTGKPIGSNPKGSMIVVFSDKVQGPPVVSIQSIHSLTLGV